MNFVLHFLKLLCCGFLLILLLPNTGFSQKASQLIKSGDKAFNKGDFLTAIEYYTQGNVPASGNDKAKFRLGYSYLQLRETDKAISLLSAVNRSTGAFNPELQLLLGQAYHLHHQFDSAMVHYREFRRYLKKDNYDARDAISNYIQECRVGKKLIETPVDVKLENLGPAINSEGHDFVPVITPDERTLVFTSRRKENMGAKLDEKGQPYEDIYTSKFINGKWQPASNLGAPINTDRHDACVAISADGKTMFLYKDTNGGDIYMTQKQGDQWSAPVSMGPNINSVDYEPSLSISDDGDYVFFSSNRPEGFGGLDIYVSIKQPDGTWGEAINLGPVINTPFDEDAPFIHSGSNTLYFSSRGPKSMGGYDIFKTEMRELTWEEPQNLGVPINTADNDIHYTVPANKYHAYYSTTRPGGLGKKDIYLVVYPLPESEKPVDVAAEPIVNTVELTGTLLNAATGKPLFGTIVFSYPNNSDQIIAFSDSVTGAYEVQVKSGRLVNISVKNSGYFNFSDKIYLPASRTEKIVHNIALKEIKIGANVVLNNIYFDLNKASIHPDAYPQLEELYNWLVENPDVRIEISGHTDNRGNPEANKILSEQRAFEVSNYLIDRGIEQSRIRAAGYGQEKPIADNATEEGRSKNRRTEFTILPN